MTGGETLARPIDQDAREAILRNVDNAIAHLRASGSAITRSAIADYIGVSSAYISKRDVNGSKNYLGAYIDKKLSEANDGCDNPEILLLRKQLQQREKVIREKDRKIDKLLAHSHDLEAKTAKLQEQCTALQITLDTLYASHFRQEKEEMRKSRIS